MASPSENRAKWREHRKSDSHEPLICPACKKRVSRKYRGLCTICVGDALALIDKLAAVEVPEPPQYSVEPPDDDQKCIEKAEAWYEAIGRLHAELRPLIAEAKRLRGQEVKE